MQNYILTEARAGSLANSKDIHCGDESINIKDIDKLKPGYACMMNEKGEVVVSDGSKFYGVRAENVQPVSIGNTETSCSIGVRRKGIVYVVFSGTKEVASKVQRGSYLKIAADGSFTVASSPNEAIGIAYSRVENNIVALEFNCDFIRVAVKNEPSPTPPPNKDAIEESAASIDNNKKIK